jgi:hypothetical protein
VPHGRLLLTSGGRSAPVVVDGGFDAAPAWSPDGGRIAFERYGDPLTPADAQLTIATLAPPSSLVLATGWAPSWSPDGTQLAFHRADGVHVVAAAGGPTRRIAAGAHPAWSPDGTWIAVANHGVQLVRPDGTGARTLTTIEARPPLLWAPDGSQLAFAEFAGAHVDVVAIDGTLRRVAVAGAPAPSSWSSDGDDLLLAGGLVLHASGRPTSPFPAGSYVEALSPDWTRTALAEVSGRFGYEGVDLYAGDGRGLRPELVSPPRCAAGTPQCREGGDGPDTLVGTDRYDLLLGHGGDDRLFGKQGPNHLEGAFGRDLLVGGGANDVLEGQLGADSIYGHRGIDYVYGGPGDDRLDAGPGQDSVYGDQGDDRVAARDGWADVVHCGSGVDTVAADQLDHLYGCEHVTRRRASR